MYFYGGICLWINIDVEYVVIHTIQKKGNHEITQLLGLTLKTCLKNGSVLRVVRVKYDLELPKDLNISSFFKLFFLKRNRERIRVGIQARYRFYGLLHPSLLVSRMLQYNLVSYFCSQDNMHVPTYPVPSSI